VARVSRLRASIRRPRTSQPPASRAQRSRPAPRRSTALHGEHPYINTIPVNEQPPFPGSREIERRIKSLVRWNALAMVVKANKLEDGIGGHISTFASAATLV
jgi:pyruvate dehydrogenase complex dehydrogenase (E1) component